MRPIDADALNTLLDDHRMSFEQGTEDERQFAEGFNAGLNRAQYCLYDAPTIAPTPRWIPVEELLPEKDCRVLVTHSNGLVCTCMFWMDEDYFLNADITHWMPLPEPPEEATP